ncbi:M24 family metallopeptidase [Clostridium sp.]|uniref:M24 family metallopeptidase n=1 Tax=Clostridium sp. TaxID=1506 RepID=UPI00262273E8|nr:M24 family metallopeptidase [Clostridium sp.]
MLIRNKEVQQIAKTVMTEISNKIEVGMKEYEIVELGESLLKENGINKFWYYNIGAFVFVGERTTISISGKEYKASDLAIKENDIITIDLSPEKDGFWGDYARTIVVQDRKVIRESFDSNSELGQGLNIEVQLHKYLAEIVNESMTFEELYCIMNEKILQLGYENLDFAKNLGHSIELHKENRKYIEKSNKMKLREVNCFTFEPHIKKQNGKYGYKMENIYYFDNGKIIEL